MTEAPREDDGSDPCVCGHGRGKHFGYSQVFEIERDARCTAVVGSHPYRGVCGCESFRPNRLKTPSASSDRCSCGHGEGYHAEGPTSSRACCFCAKDPNGDCFCPNYDGPSRDNLSRIAAALGLDEPASVERIVAEFAREAKKWIRENLALKAEIERLGAQTESYSTMLREFARLRVKGRRITRQLMRAHWAEVKRAGQLEAALEALKKVTPRSRPVPAEVREAAQKLASLYHNEHVGVLSTWVLEQAQEEKP